MKKFNVSTVISYGSNNTTAQVITYSFKLKKLVTKHLRLVNGTWKCNNGHIYILPQ